MGENILIVDMDGGNYHMGNLHCPPYLQIIKQSGWLCGRIAVGCREVI